MTANLEGQSSQNQVEKRCRNILHRIVIAVEQLLQGHVFDWISGAEEALSS